MAPSRRWVPSSSGSAAVASPNLFQSGFSAPLLTSETLQSSSSSSSFRNLKFHPRDYTSSRSSVNTHSPPPWKGTFPLAPVAVWQAICGFPKIDFSTGELWLKLPDLRQLPAECQSGLCSKRPSPYRWQIARDKKQLAHRRTVEKIIGQLFRSVMSGCLSRRQRGATWVCWM